MPRPKDRLSASQLRELLTWKLKDYDGGRGMEIPQQFPDELEGLCFSLRVLDKVIGDLFEHTKESSPQYPMVNAYSWWTIHVVTSKNSRSRAVDENLDEETHVQALVEFLIKNTRWIESCIDPCDELDDEQPLSLEEIEPDLDEDYPDQDDDHFGRLIGWKRL